MRQSVYYSLFVCIALFILTLAGCGGGIPAEEGTGVPTTLVIAPSSLSMTPGQVVQLSATVLDGASNIITNINPIYSSTGAAAVSTGGLACAGTWDSLTTPVICTPGPITGSGTVTVATNGLTTVVPVAVHTRIARVSITTTPPALCNSQTETQQYNAHAFDANGVDITAQSGIFTYNSSNTTSVTIDTNGLATSVLPGGAFVTASNNGVVSVPALFNACAPLSISLTPSTPAALTIGGSLQLTAAVIDVKGNPMTSVPLSYLSSQPGAISLSSGGLISAVDAASAGVIASCSPPNCNAGANANIPVYSNLIPVTVSGSSTTSVYVTGATANSIIPIDVKTNTLLTAITIPQVSSNSPIINSFVFASDGTVAYLGSDRSMLIFDPTVNTVTTPSVLVPGKVLAVSPDKGIVIVADQTPTAPKTFVYDVNAGVFTQLGMTTVTTAARFSPDSLKAYIASGGSLWAFSAALAPPLSRQVVTSTTVNDATFVTQGSLGYVAGPASAVTARATCDNSPVSTVPVPLAPLKIESNFDSSRVFAVDGTNVDDIHVSNISTAANTNCPATVSNSVSTVSFNQGAFTPGQLILTSDGNNLFVTVGSNKLLRYNSSTGATSAITLASGTAITTGGATLDNASVYVGATGTNDVHRIDVAGGTDAQQIVVGLKDANGAAVSPDFVVVQPK